MVEAGKPNKRALAGFRRKDEHVAPHKTKTKDKALPKHVKAAGQTKAQQEKQKRTHKVKSKGN